MTTDVKPTAAGAAPILTIDGPGGSGKGTIARALASRLNWHLLDSGAIYRLAAMASMQRGIDHTEHASDLEKLLDVCAHLNASFQRNADGSEKIVLDGEDVSLLLRDEATGEAASKIAIVPEVRAALLNRQRQFHQPPGLVADGRDMGTVVFPDANSKIFLTASLSERVKRRHKQLKGQGISISIDALFRDMAKRDERDANRKVSPLTPADDATVVDCSTLSIAEVVDKVLGILREQVALDEPSAGD